MNLDPDPHHWIFEFIEIVILECALCIRILGRNYNAKTGFGQFEKTQSGFTESQHCVVE